MKESQSLPILNHVIAQRPYQSRLERFPRKQASYRIGFVSTRFAGTDGVSLETRKWATVFERMGHHCFYFAGRVDTPADCSRVVPEAFFGHPDVDGIQKVAFAQQVRPSELTRRIAELKEYLKAQIAAFVRDFGIEVLVVENALTIPMHIPLGLALTEFIAETAFPTIAHHHDFFWERQRFLTNCVEDYLAMSFPPRLPSIRHVVINSHGVSQLSHRLGAASVLIPNVMDFDNPPPPPDRYAHQLHRDLGLSPDEQLVLQPTRIVQRKGIEHAIELLSRIDRKTRLVISHASGDEGDDYQQRVCNFADLLGVKIEFVANLIDEERRQADDGRTIYALRDIYYQSALVTYPSLIEGFGNAFLEAVYFGRPVVVNNYPVFDTDIKPKGFRVIAFENYITDETVRHAQEVLDDPDLAQEMAEHNYLVARQHYSYTVLEQSFQVLLADLQGPTRRSRATSPGANARMWSIAAD